MCSFGVRAYYSAAAAAAAAAEEEEEEERGRFLLLNVQERASAVSSEDLLWMLTPKPCSPNGGCTLDIQ